jgi:hypothetical protein
MDPNMGLGSLYVMAKNKPIMIHAKNDRASKAVAKGKNPEKMARCNNESEWATKPANASQNPNADLSVAEKSRKTR